jgi:poly(beta-D-mannuronate) lyase
MAKALPFSVSQGGEPMRKGQGKKRNGVRQECSPQYGLASLVMIAELGEINGLDLYAERGYAIKRLVERCIEGLKTADYFQHNTGVPQVTDEQIQAWQISWAQPYTRRFPDPKISELIDKAARLNYTTLGGLPSP